MNIAGDFSRRRVRTALHLERTDFAVEFGGAITKSVALVHFASAVQYLTVRANVNASPPIPAKVAARQCPIVALTGIADRDVRCNSAANQPVQEAASPLTCIRRKALRVSNRDPLTTAAHYC